MKDNKTNRIIPSGYAPFKGCKLEEKVSRILNDGKDKPCGYAEFKSNKN